VRNPAATAETAEALSIAIVGAVTRRASRRWQADMFGRVAIGSTRAVDLRCARDLWGEAISRNRFADLRSHALGAAGTPWITAYAPDSASTARARLSTARGEREANDQARR